MKKIGQGIILVVFMFCVVTPGLAQKNPEKKMNLNAPAIKEMADFYAKNKKLFDDPELMKTYMRVVQTLKKKEK